MTTFIVRFNEIALKGQNRGQFVRQLMKNIWQVLEIDHTQVARQTGQVLVRVADDRITETRRVLARTFGVAWFTQVSVCPSTLEDITITACELALPLLDENTTFAVDANRAVKKTPFNSMEINRHVGAVLNQKTGAPVNLSKPDVTVYISVRGNKTNIYTEKIPGPGGLPVGTNGRVLALLSGGFDSIAAAYLLARRGAQVDFLHFHVYPNAERVAASKMSALWEKLSEYTLSKQVFLAGYTPFQMATLDLPVRLSKYELATFRRLMARVGDKLAYEYGYDALVMGDSLGQVASQTMQNLVLVDRAVEVPIFRPLIGMDKLDVTKLVEALGLWDLAVVPYKDCCSLIARQSSTQGRSKRVQELEQLIDVDQIATDISAQVEIVSLNGHLKAKAVRAGQVAEVK